MRKDHAGRFLFLVLAMLVLSIVDGRAQTTSIPLVWDPSPDASIPGKITGYKLYFAPHSLTNVVPGLPVPSTVTVINAGNHTNLTVTSLIGGLTYFFAVTALDSEGTESDFSNFTTFTVPTGDTTPPPPPSEEPPPGGAGSGTGSGSGSGTTTTGTTTTGSGTTTTGTTTTGSGSGTGDSDSGTNTIQANLVGLLPRLGLSRNPTNKNPILTLSGALGATFTIESTTGVIGGGAEQWTTVTNIKMSEIATDFAEPAGGALVKAFVPSVQDWEDTNSAGGGLRVYRIIMPHGYAVVADEVLKTNGYNTRLVAIRLADLDAQIVCYVTEEGAYLHYDDETFFVSLETSGATIREVADKFGSVIQQNWTSASEFTIVDGLKQILATVVKTDDPSTDPPLGSSGGVNIAIDF